MYKIYGDIKPIYSFECKGTGSRSGKYSQTKSTKLEGYTASGYHGNDDAGQKHRLDKKEAGQKQHWEGNKVVKYKVSFTDGTPSITVNASSPEEARAQFKEKKIKTIRKVK